MTIWKFPLVATDFNEIMMPRGADILTIQTQAEVPCLWATVDPSETFMELRKFRTVGTGHPFNPDGHEYIGTFQLMGGSLIFHVFEARR